MRGSQDTFVCPQSLADSLACNSDSLAEMVQCLRQKTSEEMILAYKSVCSLLGEWQWAVTQRGFCPVPAGAEGQSAVRGEAATREVKGLGA